MSEKQAFLDAWDREGATTLKVLRAFPEGKTDLKPHDTCRSANELAWTFVFEGIGGAQGASWEVDPADWWRVYETNVLGVHICCRAVIPGMLERGRGRIVITGSGAAYLPGMQSTAYAPSKAAVCRYGETLANELAGRIPVFFFSPGLVKTEMTSDFGDDLPWTPPELAPRLVHVLASGRADALAGRYIHAEHDDIEDLIRRADEIKERDLNAIRLRR